MSAIYYPTCPDTITDPLCTPCPTKELGGIRSLVLKKSTFSFTDITNPTEWTNAICNKNIFVIPFTRGSLAVSLVEGQGFGDNSTVNDGYDYVISAFDPNYTGNCDFWTDIAAMAPIEEDIKSKVTWNVSLKWSQEDPLCPLDIPVGIFDRCTQCS